MSGTVVHEADEGFRLPEIREDAPRDLDVLHLVAAGDVVGLARRAVIEQEVDRLGMVLDVEPVAHVAAVAVER